MSLPLLGYTIEMFGSVACLLMGISVLIKQPSCLLRYVLAYWPFYKNAAGIFIRSDVRATAGIRVFITPNETGNEQF